MLIDWSCRKTAAQVAAEQAPRPDWRGFLEAVKGTSVFTALQEGSRVDVGVNALATELRLALGEAALGLPDVGAIQGRLNELAPSLSGQQALEIGALVQQFHIPLSLPG